MNKKGFAHIEILFVILAIAVLGISIFFVQRTSVPSCYTAEFLNRKNTYHNPGSLSFRAKSGTQKNEILSSLQSISLDVDILEHQYYAPGDRSTLFIRHTLSANEAKDDIEPILAGFEIVPEETEYYLESADVLYARTLSEIEQSVVNSKLDALKEKNLIQEYSWNTSPKKLDLVVLVPEDKEDEYINKIYKLGLFECVDKQRNLMPIMPIFP